VRVAPGWRADWTETRRLYATRDPSHLDAFTSLHRQALLPEGVCERRGIHDDPGMNWVVADASAGYGLPAKHDFVALVGLAPSLLEHGYGMEERPFSDPGLLVFNREMAEVQWQPA